MKALHTIRATLAHLVRLIHSAAPVDAVPTLEESAVYLATLEIF